MRISQFFSPTLRETPADAEVISHQLLLRAGFIRQQAAGIFHMLPLGYRVQRKIEAIIREEMNAIGGQEVLMPVVQSANIWKETGRWSGVGREMGRFTDRTGQDMALAMTHEEALTDMIRRDIHSHRQLPMLLYHIQTKWRDDPRPRAGLIRAREFTMLDSYSLDADEDSLDAQYRAHYQSYFRIFRRCGLDVISVESDTGMMGGSMAHEFMYLTPIGEDTLILCSECGYTANRQIAHFDKGIPEAVDPQTIEKIPTPDTATIADLAAFLNIPETQTAKALMMVVTIEVEGQDTEQFIFAVLRGDMQANETKLANAVNAKELRPATDDEIIAAGAVPGYASPVGLEGITIIVDDLIPQSPNLVAGANEAGFHLLNVNYGRDYEADIITDIASAGEGDRCVDCGEPLHAERGVETGNIFKLGTRYSEAMGCTFTADNGKAEPVIMGSYGIGVGRLIACLAESYHDDRGLVWPASVAPFDVHMIGMKGTESEADNLYEQLRAAGIETLYDDRKERPGVKFNDADLIGCPLRLTLGKRALAQGGVEMKRRDQEEGSVIPLAEIVEQVRSERESLNSMIWQSAQKEETF